MGDTLNVKFQDSSSVYRSGNEQVLLIQDLRKETSKEWYESPWVSSFIIPILVAAFVAWLTNFINKQKNKIEIDKLKLETANLKRSFQPIVISTLQSIQDKIVPEKIEALKNLVKIKNEFTYHEQQYNEGEPFTPGYAEYLSLLFHNFSYSNFNAYRDFHNKYSYLFPNKVFTTLKDLDSKISG